MDSLHYRIIFVPVKKTRNSLKEPFKSSTIPKFSCVEIIALQSF